MTDDRSGNADVETAPHGDGAFDRWVAEREDGRLFSEVDLLRESAPRTMRLIARGSDYVHVHFGAPGAHQNLTVQMRELIALCHLSAKGDDRFAARHVRRLWQLGVTTAAIIEAGEAIAPIVGWSTILHLGQAITLAADRDYPFGDLPEGGAPGELTVFAELSLGRDREPSEGADSLAATPEWQYVASLEPGLAAYASTWVDHCLRANGAEPGDVLGPGVRELIAVAACCWRGEVELAAEHICRSYAYGLSDLQVLEAISCVLPMTGALTVQIGVRAMWLAGSEVHATER